METRRVYLAGAVRTPVGNFGGAYAGSSAAYLAGVAATAAIERSGVPRESVDELLLGHARMRATARTSRARSCVAPGSRMPCPRSRSTRRARAACRPW